MNRSHSRLLLLLVMSLFISLSSASFAQVSKATGKRKSAANAKASTRELPAGVSEFSSKNFLLHTDLSAADSKELLERLEKMLVLVSGYFGKPNSQIIEMNVVADRGRWPGGSIPAEAIDSIVNDAGITLSVTASLQDQDGEKQVVAAKSIVWAVASRGVPQHEAVHAYCHQNFGRTGPTWYAEGMAEMGQYWREKDDGVRIHDGVLQYLKESEPKDLIEITAPGQKTGDSWQNYAWRWALCNLLAANPNYAPRFKPLGMALLNDQKTRFEDVYGPMAKEISFEYLFFLHHIGQGFRCDLCAWDWKTKSSRIRGSATAQAKILANRGWQPSRVMLKKGDKISFTATGEWILKKDGTKVSADGDNKGHGKLVGILFDDYQLSQPFELGQSGDFEAPSDGNLFIRCQDDWCELADNTGTVTVKFSASRTDVSR